MDITLRTIEGRRYLQQLHPLRGGDSAGRASGDLVVARALEQRRQPAQLGLRAAVDQYIRAVEGDDKAGLGIDEVRVFGRLGERFTSTASRRFLLPAPRVGVVATTLIFLPGGDCAAPGPASTATVSRIMLVISVILTC